MVELVRLRQALRRQRRPDEALAVLAVTDGTVGLEELGHRDALDHAGRRVTTVAALGRGATGGFAATGLTTTLALAVATGLSSRLVRRDGEVLGYIRAASYGHTLGGAVGLAMIEADVPIDQAFLDAGAWEVEIAGRRYAARASLAPLYDPDMARVRA